MTTPKIEALKQLLAATRNELDTAVRILNLQAATAEAIADKDAAERKIEKLEAEIFSLQERELAKTSVSLSPDTIIRQLTLREYQVLADAANRLGRTWKKQLLEEHARGGHYDRLGIPDRSCAAIQSAINRLGTRLNGMVATQDFIDQTEKP